jgi:hypothetical protein
VLELAAGAQSMSLETGLQASSQRASCYYEVMVGNQGKGGHLYPSTCCAGLEPELGIGLRPPNLALIHQQHQHQIARLPAPEAMRMVPKPVGLARSAPYAIPGRGAGGAPGFAPLWRARALPVALPRCLAPRTTHYSYSHCLSCSPVSCLSSLLPLLPAACCACAALPSAVGCRLWLS